MRAKAAGPDRPNGHKKEFKLGRCVVKKNWIFWTGKVHFNWTELYELYFSYMSRKFSYNM